MASLRLSNAVLGGLARPSFSSNVGTSIAAGMLGVERRDREEEQRLVQQSTLDLMQKAQIAQETGDMGMLTGASNDLNALLTQTKNAESRQLIMDSINTVNQQRGATQAKKTTNTAMSILNTEKALQNFDQQVGPLSAQELLVQKTLKERLAMMKQNTAAATEASTIQYKADVQALERDATLREKRVEAATNVLASLDPNSEKYKKTVARLDSAGLGKAVRQDKSARQAIEKADGEIRAQRLQTGPLSAEEMATAEEMGLSIKDRNDPLSRKLYNAAMETRIKEEVKIAIQPISTPEQPRAEALAKAQLGIIARQGDFFDIPFYRDIATKIEDMSEEQTADLMGRIDGLAEAQIPNEVNAWLYENFPKEMARSAKFAEKNRMDAEDIGRLTNSILRNQGINVADATEEQIAVAQRQAELAIAGAESALQRQAPEPGGEGRRKRRGPSQVAEPYTFDRKTGTGGQMNRRQRP
jgi:hypothetical protein